MALLLSQAEAMTALRSFVEMKNRASKQKSGEERDREKRWHRQITAQGMGVLGEEPESICVPVLAPRLMTTM